MLEVPVSLIRVGSRYGFKVKTTEAEKVHEHLYPGEPYLSGPGRTVYRVGPFPWGTTKKAIQQLFQQLGWTEKPIHSFAKAKDDSGLMWMVHASQPPGHLVYQLQHGDVIIHQEHMQDKDQWRPPQAQASRNELKAQVQDEVFINDPWADSARQLSRPPDHALQMQSLEASLDKKIAQQLEARMERDETMAPEVEPRILALEQQMAQLQQRSVQLDSKVDFLHQQVEHQASKFEHSLDQKLSEQMHRIEMLITKRARQE